MKFICTQENISRGLNKVTPVAGRNTQLPALQHVLLQLKQGVLHLTCTDLEVGIHVTVPGKVEEIGECTIPARKLSDYIGLLPKTNPIILELKKNILSIKTKGFNASFTSAKAEDFPSLPKPSSQSKITVEGSRFCNALTRTLFAAARDDTRPEIHSVLLTGNSNNIIIAATDSFRLTEEIFEAKQQYEGPNILLPLNTAQEVVRLFSGHDKIDLIPQENHITFLSDTTELSSRLVEGKYPDYKQIIPTKFKTEGTINIESLMRALKTVSVFLPRDSRRVKLNISPANNKIIIIVGGETGEGKVEVDFDGEGEDINILFNIQYLLDGAQHIPGEEVTLRLLGDSDPIILQPTNNETQFKYIVMPIQAE